MAIPHPFPYQGSKRKIAKQILSFLPKHKSFLIEPFAGSAAVSIAAAYFDKSDNFVINDRNQSIISLWDAILKNPKELSSKYRKLWKQQIGNERTFYDEVRHNYNKHRQPEQFLYLLARCVKASVRYNNVGEFNQSPDNRRKGMEPDTMGQNLFATSFIFSKKRVKLFSKDYRDILKMATEESIVYMDPPYQGVCNNRDPRYIQGVEFDDFMRSLVDLNSRNIPFILSYDGKTGDKTYGREIPDILKLKQVFINAGPSTQATLLGRTETTLEALYLSPTLLSRIKIEPQEAVSQLELAFA